MKKIKVYLDTSVYNRPFDDQQRTRIRLETEAFLSILEKAVSGSIIIIASLALTYENSQNPFVDRRERISSYLSIASKFIQSSESIKKRALALEGIGVDSIDALHLAFAESEADFFITCDDDIVKKVRKQKDIFKIEVYNPLEFILKEVFKSA